MCYGKNCTVAVKGGAKIGTEVVEAWDNEDLTLEFHCRVSSLQLNLSRNVTWPASRKSRSIPQPGALSVCAANMKCYGGEIVPSRGRDRHDRRDPGEAWRVHGRVHDHQGRDVQHQGGAQDPPRRRKSRSIPQVSSLALCLRRRMI